MRDATGSPTVAAVLAAAGFARRLGRADGKAFLPLAGQPLLSHSLRILHGCSFIDRIVVAHRAEDEAEIERLVERNGWSKCVGHLVRGGAERFDSVRAALAHLAPDPPDVVLIHDAARPLLTADLALRSVGEAARFSAAVVAIPATDTVKVSRAEGFLHETPSRAGLWQVQTPQTFRFDAIWQAYAAADEAVARSVTDDAELLERRGQPIRIVPGPRYNIKITVPEDLRVAEALLAARGTGV